MNNSKIKIRLFNEKILKDATQIFFVSVSLKIRVNQLIMKLDCKNIICVLLEVFFTIIQF